MLVLLVVIGFLVVTNVAHHYINTDGLLRPKDERVAWSITWRNVAIQLAVVAGIAMLALMATADVQASELCPVADERLNRAVNYRGELLTALARQEEARVAVASLKSANGDARTAAIMRLAMAGNLQAFHHLYQTRDTNGLFTYALRYLNRDDTVCVDPEIESAMLDGLRDPEMGSALIGFLGNNTYRDIRLLQMLLQVPFPATPGNADKYLPFGRGITSTHLPDIEPLVLAHARTLLNFDTPVKKRVLPGLHQHYVEFFADRGYAPALPYFTALLRVAERDEPIQSFQIANGMLRGVVQWGLSRLDSVEANAILIEQLEEIASKPLDAFTAAELQTLSRLIRSPTQPDKFRAVVAAYQLLLATEQVRPYQYSMRRTVYPALVDLNAPSSSALLIAELERFVAAEPPPDKSAVVAILFEALADAQALDINALRALISENLAASDRRGIWHVSAMHPSEQSVDLLLAELAIAGSTDGPRLLGSDAAEVLIDALLSFESPPLLRRVRSGIDDLFEAGGFDESHYVNAASRLNASLGDESPRYVAFQAERARQRAAEEQAQYTAAIEQGRRESHATYRRELASHVSKEGIARDVAAVSAGVGQERQAFQWLVIVGRVALPELHAALGAARTSDAGRFQIMNALGEIGSPSSIEPLIAAAESSAEDALYRAALFALALILPTDEALGFARAQLATGVPERRQIAVLVYLAQIRSELPADVVAQYVNPAQSARLRTAAIYFKARLGHEDALAGIRAALQQTPDRSELETLLVSLAEVVSSPEEFARVASLTGATSASSSYREALAYCDFRTASGDDKVALAFKLLENGGMWQRRAAIRYLISADPQGTLDRMTGGYGQMLPLNKLMTSSSGMQLLFSESRRMGYILEQTAAGYALTKN